MADKINDGGPAIPTPVSIGGYEIRAGMSLRDWFAGMALQCLVVDFDNSCDVNDVACNAYFLADAMLRVRTRK